MPRDPCVSVLLSIIAQLVSIERYSALLQLHATAGVAIPDGSRAGRRDQSIAITQVLVESLGGILHMLD